MNTSSQKGFTLIELMVVIVIIAILATIGAVMYSSTQRAAKISKRSQDLKALQIALTTYKASNATYPATFAVGGTLNYNHIDNTLATPLVPAYMPALPLEPSGFTNQYRYASNGIDYKIITNPAVSLSGEMTATEFNTIPNLIDPARDQNGANCTIETGASVAGWAIFTSGACLW